LFTVTEIDAGREGEDAGGVSENGGKFSDALISMSLYTERCIKVGVL